jgi:hypothetical protein
MRLKRKEPDFSAATALLGQDIAEQLIRASRMARPQWEVLFQRFKTVLPEVVAAVRSRVQTSRHPLVGKFMVEWANNIPWGTCRSGCYDAIGIKVPVFHLERLAKFGAVEDFSFMLGDTGTFSSATLGNNDHNREFGLILNCPAWLNLASYPEHQNSFERQIRLVIHHEMAHFSYQVAGSRSELHAHCRGVASVLWSENKLPRSAEEFVALIGQGYPEIAQNNEIEQLILKEPKAPWRIIRLWLFLFTRYCR